MHNVSTIIIMVEEAQKCTVKRLTKYNKKQEYNSKKLNDVSTGSTNAAYCHQFYKQN